MTEQLEITPQQARDRLRKSQEVVVIDVREPDEFSLARLEPSELVPMGTIPVEFQRLERMADYTDLLLLCHHGVRSLQVAAWLRQRGVENCWSISGGIDRWSREIDPSIPRY